MMKYLKYCVLILLICIIYFSFKDFFIRGVLRDEFTEQQEVKLSRLSGDMSGIARACQEYFEVHRQLTNNIREIVDLPWYKDIWGSDFYITDHKYVTSAGPDKTKNTKDDIYILYSKTKSEIKAEIRSTMKTKEMKKKFY